MPTYADVISQNINGLRESLLRMSEAGNTDCALTASREALGAARSIEAMFNRRSSNVFLGAQVPPPPARKQRQKRRRQ